jgi:hypothetical protein
MTALPPLDLIEMLLSYKAFVHYAAYTDPRNPTKFAPM